MASRTPVGSSEGRQIEPFGSAESPFRGQHPHQTIDEKWIAACRLMDIRDDPGVGQEAGTLFDHLGDVFTAETEKRDCNTFAG
jgi:hypothetical protein